MKKGLIIVGLIAIGCFVFFAFTCKCEKKECEGGCAINVCAETKSEEIAVLEKNDNPKEKISQKDSLKEEVSQENNTIAELEPQDSEEKLQ